MNRIENQKSIIIIHDRSYMKCVKIMIIARNTCHDEAIYMSILHQTMTFHSFSSFSES